MLQVNSPDEARELVNAIAAEARQTIDDIYEVEKASKLGPHRPHLNLHSSRRYLPAFAKEPEPIGEVLQLMDIIADTKIDLAAMPSGPGLRARIYAYLDDYQRELAGSIGAAV